MVVFGQLQWSVWWTMLPKDKHLGDITAAKGIYFYLLLPLFLSIKILKAVVTSVMNMYTLSITNMIEFSHSVTSMGLFKMEVTIFKYKCQVMFDHYFF